MIRENSWVLVTGTQKNNNRKIARWYRVISNIANDGGEQQRLFVAGPDWDKRLLNVNSVIVVEGVIGVYTSPVVVSDNLKWK